MWAVLLQYWPAVVAAIVAAYGGWKLRQSGVNAERARQAEKTIAAAEDRLEMDREANDVDRHITGMTDAEAQKEANRWARPHS